MAGDRTLKYYLSGFFDINTLTNNRWDPDHYGAFQYVMGTVLEFVTGLELYLANHLMTAIFALLGIIGTWRTGRMLFGAQAGFWAAVFLTLIPMYHGHAVFNSKDVPFAACVIWSIYYLLQIYEALPNPSIKTILGFSIMAGLASGVRVGGLVLLGYLGFAIGLWFLLDAYQQHFKSLKDRSYWLLLFSRHYLLAFVTTYVTMIVFWPWTHNHPLKNPLESLSVMSNYFYQENLVVMFKGHQYLAGDLPFDYILTFFMISLPEFILCLILVTLCFGLARIFACLKNKQLTSHAGSMFLLTFTVIFPPLFIIVRDSLMYNRVRHLIFIIPPLCCLLAWGWMQLVEFLRNRSPKLVPVVFVVLASCCLYQTSLMVRLHPNQYIYYNRLVGGVKGVGESYGELDYWGNSKREAVERLVIHLEKESPNSYATNTYWVAALNHHSLSTTYFYPPNFRRATKSKEADYIIASPSWRTRRKPLITVERLGAPLSHIYRGDRPPGKPDK